MSTHRNKNPQIFKDFKCPNCNTKKSIQYKFSYDKFDIFFCSKCTNAFTFPIPHSKKLERYYHANYWNSPGKLGYLKNMIFIFFQKRRIEWIKNYLSRGTILDVGAGEGRFIKSLGNKYQVIGLDSPSSKIKNKDIIKINLLKWRPGKKFDAIVFWESLEHLPKPQKYLKKSSKLVKQGGYIFIEYPRFDSLESKFFKQHWFHLDPPRHLSHLTEKGLKIILSRSGFKIISYKNIPAFEYAVWGFLASILQILNIRKTDSLKQKGNLFLLICILPLLILSLISEIVLLLLGQSPIGLMVARKK